MPIPVVCPSCGSKLNAPDAAVGKRVKCPKCQSAVPVPGGASGSTGGSQVARPPATRVPPPPPEPPVVGGSAFDFSAPAAPPPPKKSPSRSSSPKSPALPPPEPLPAADAGFDFTAPAAPPPPKKRSAPVPPPPALPPPGAGSDFSFEGQDDLSPATPPSRPRRPGSTERKPPRATDDLEPIEERSEDAPRPRSRKPGAKAPAGKKKGPSLALILGGAGLLLLMFCGGVGGGVYYFVIKPGRDALKNVANDLEKDLQNAAKNSAKGGGSSGGTPAGTPAVPPAVTPTSKAAIPAGWKAFQPPDGAWKAYFPGNADNLASGDFLKGMKVYVGFNIQQKISCSVTVGTPEGMTAAEGGQNIDSLIKMLGGPAGLTQVSRKEATLAGLPATEVVFDLTSLTVGGKKAKGKAPQSVARILIVDSVVYTLMITNAEPGRPKLELENGFFDNFELTK